MSKRAGSRQGAVLVFVMVCVLVVVGVVAGAMRDTFRYLKDKRILQQRRQTELLLEAGIARLIDLGIGDSGDWTDLWDASAAFESFDTAVVTTDLVERNEQAVVLNVSARMQQGTSSYAATQVSQQVTIEISANVLSEENENE